MGCVGCVETILICLNWIHLVYYGIAGVGLVIYGAIAAYIILISNSPEVLRDYGTIVPSGFTIILGILMIVFVFMGCCGICRESTCCMETYSAFLIILALAHLALGSYCVVVYNNSFESNLSLRIQTEVDMDRNVASYRSNPKIMDDIQKWMHCCGNKNALEEYNFSFDNSGGSYSGELPGSCCENQKICDKSAADRYQNGCTVSVYQFTVATNLLLGYISLAVGAIELLAALLGICLSCCIWRNRSASWR